MTTLRITLGAAVLGAVLAGCGSSVKLDEAAPVVDARPNPNTTGGAGTGARPSAAGQSGVATVDVGGGNAFKIVRHNFTGLFTQLREVEVTHHGHQPGPEVCPGFKAIEIPVGLEKRLLHQILGLSRIPGKTPGKGRQPLHMGTYHDFEMPAVRSFFRASSCHRLFHLQGDGAIPSIDM